MILDDDNKSGIDPSAWIKLLNQCTHKPLSVTTIKEEFLFSVQKSTLP